MTDHVSPEKRTQMMRAVGSTDTSPELRLRRALWAKGLRYGVNRKLESVRVDIVFSGVNLAVFVDGCFWHGCPEHYGLPKTNSAFWAAKVERNQERDRRNDRDLTRAGWTVLRFWECEVKRNVHRAVAVVERLVRLPAAGQARTNDP